ncbi:MAG TPA: amidohydrolase family protein [Candidatus Baltobacteraceae bacterium]|nr:amidohydrolase family protein [Candidatus Baltobacteraceae bacterium]
MQKRLFAALLALCLTGQTPPDLGAPPVSAVISYHQPVIAIEHVGVIDGTGAPERRDQTIVVSNGKITAAGRAATVRVPSDAKVIDGRGFTLTPGFVGTHDHLYYVSGGPLFIMREMPYSFPRLYLAGGVTTIRTTGSVEPYTDLRVKRAVDSGELAGPHMDVTSPYMTGYEPFFVQMGTLRSPADARRTVDFWADRGVTSFKLYMNIPRAVAQAVIDQAHARHLKVLAHLCSIGFEQAARMGVDSLEHGIFVDTEFTPGKTDDECDVKSPAQTQAIADLDVNGPKAQALIRTLISHHVALSSTLANFEGRNPPPMRVEQRMFNVLDPVSVSDVMAVRKMILARPASSRALARKAFDNDVKFEVAFYHAGGLLTQGPDPTGYGATIAGFGDQRDIELLVQGGLKPEQAIQVATLNGAKSLGRGKTIGSIAAGKNADLVLIHGDPAARIDDIENVVTVFKDGVGYDAKRLIDSVKGVAGRQ